MKPSRSLFSFCFTLLMLCFCLLLFAWVPLKSSLDIRLADAALSLETSQGRERKQQNEYDQVSEELPRVRESLAEAEPLAAAAQQEVSDLKARRKQLRAEKSRLETLLATAEAAPEEDAP